MDTENYMIPRRLDDPPMFLLWEMDEAIAFVMPVLGALALSSSLLMVFVGALLGFLAMQAVARIKANGGKQLFFQSLYWYLPPDTVTKKMKRIPPSAIREYIG